MTRPKHIGAVKTLYANQLRVWKSKDRITLYFKNQAIPLTHNAAEQLRNLLERADSEP